MIFWSKTLTVPGADEERLALRVFFPVALVEDEDRVATDDSCEPLPERSIHKYAIQDGCQDGTPFKSVHLDRHYFKN